MTLLFILKFLCCIFLFFLLQENIYGFYFIFTLIILHCSLMQVQLESFDLKLACLVCHPAWFRMGLNSKPTSFYLRFEIKAAVCYLMGH